MPYIDRFPPEVVVKAVFTVVAPQTACFPTGVVSVDGFSRTPIDVQLAAFHVTDSPHHPVHIISKEISCEPVSRVVGKPQSLVESRELHDWDDRTKNLLLHDSHVLSYSN